MNGVTIQLNTTAAAIDFTTPVSDRKAHATTVSSTVLVFARDSASAYSAYSGLNGYAIPYQVVVVPQNGIDLPVLNSTATQGNYGAIVILSEVSYDYGDAGFTSALDDSQWAALYQYQVSFGVRMVRLDIAPSAETGSAPLGGCCDDGVEQYLNITDTTAFPTAGLKTGQGVSTLGLYHYPATITNTTIATEFAKFGASTGFSKASTAAVINNINGRQQVSGTGLFESRLTIPRWPSLLDSRLIGVQHPIIFNTLGFIGQREVYVCFVRQESQDLILY